MNAQDLQSSILQLAIKGKLVEQREEEGTAEELYQQIQEEKERIIKEGKFRKQEKLPEIDVDETPFEIPETWKWIRLSDLVFLKSGGQYTETNDGKLYIKVADMNLPENEYEITSSTRRAIANETALIPKDSIIFPKRGGAIATNKKKLVIQSDILIDSNTMSMTSIKKECLMYIYTWFMSIDLGMLSTGSAVPQVNNKDIYPLLFALPPLEEQKRIVAKIEELMPFVNQYGNAYKEVTKLNKKFPVEMEKSILQYAIQGKLVEQRDEEGTAYELYQQIQEEKQKLIDEGIIKKQNKLTESPEEEVPFDIPNTWKWVKLGDVLKVTMGQSPKGKYVFEGSEGIEFHQGKKLFGDSFLSESSQSTTKPTKIVNPNAVLISVRAPVGTVNITKREICIGRGLCGIEVYKDIEYEYVFYMLNAIEYEFLKKATGTTFTAVTAKVVTNQLIPLPPLEEQKRIVIKIKELLSYTNTLLMKTK